MTCRNCGYENPDGTLFCLNCGTSLTKNKTNIDNNIPVKENNTSTMILVIIITSFILIVVTIFVIYSAIYREVKNNYSSNYNNNTISSRASY